MITWRGVVTVVAALTAVAGGVGVLRQRSESQRVRRGVLAPASAAVDLPPAREPGRLGAATAAWRPAPPTTILGRVFVALWAAPLTLPGLVLAWIGRGQVRWDRDLRCLVAVGIGGPSGAALGLVGADANTIGQIVLVRQRRPSRALLAHEAAHVRQAERLGPLTLPVYVWLAARFGYRDHPMERAARAVARAAVTAP